MKLRLFLKALTRSERWQQLNKVGYEKMGMKNIATLLLI